MPQIQGGKGEAVVGYAELLPTKEMRYHRLSQGVNNLAVFSNSLDIIHSEFHKIARKCRKGRLLLLFENFCHVVYATIGYYYVSS
jgi:hypothetical protein